MFYKRLKESDITSNPLFSAISDLEGEQVGLIEVTEFVKEVLKEIKLSLDQVKMFPEKGDSKFEIKYHHTFLQKVLAAFPPNVKLIKTLNKFERSLKDTKKSNEEMLKDILMIKVFLDVQIAVCQESESPYFNVSVPILLTSSL